MDGDGTFDGGEPTIASFTENGPIANDDSIAINHTFGVNINEVCEIIAFIDSTGLDLCDHVEFPLGIPQLLNAGDDELFCSDEPITINTTLGEPDCNGLTGYTYNSLHHQPSSLQYLRLHIS